jgi:hypothetical protein
MCSSRQAKNGNAKPRNGGRYRPTGCATVSAFIPKADIAPSEDLLCLTATFLGAAVLRWRTGKVRARIAPAAFCQRVWSALFKRAILAVPILAIVYHGAPGCYVGRRRQAEGQMTSSHPDYRNHAGHRHPLWCVLVITTNNRIASFCCSDVRFGSKADIRAAVYSPCQRRLPSMSLVRTRTVPRQTSNCRRGLHKHTHT